MNSNTHLPLIFAAYRIGASPEWFIKNVHAEITDKTQSDGQWMYSIESLDKWKADIDLKRSQALDELAALSQWFYSLEPQALDEIIALSQLPPS